MKTYNELTKEQQTKAITKCLNNLLEGILQGAIVFNDKLNRNNLQARIDKAIAKAERMQTPWFAHEYIMDTCKQDLEGMAQCDAEDSLYSEKNEHIIKGVA